MRLLFASRMREKHICHAGRIDLDQCRSRDPWLLRPRQSFAGGRVPRGGSIRGGKKSRRWIIMHSSASSRPRVRRRLTMDRFQATLRHSLPVGAILFPRSALPPHPARADDIGANQSELIQRLLPTVVNIAVTKDEPLDRSADAAAPALRRTPHQTSGPTWVLASSSISQG